MAALPRIAIAAVQAQADVTALVWGLMEAAQRTGRRVQAFASHAYFSPHDGATAITGLPPRHLDSWLMSESVCREVFLRGCRTSDLAIVEGAFQNETDENASEVSDLGTLCRWLDLPCLGVIDARLLAEGHLPRRPDRLDGLLLDRVADAAEFEQLKACFEARWEVPVLGWLGRCEALRREMEFIPPGRQPALGLCHALGDEIARTVQLKAVQRIAASRSFPDGGSRGLDWLCDAAPHKLRVAVAFDDVFCGYFPDTLDVLELRGAVISDFSPLRDEQLPPGTDVVYVGCGHPERYATELSKNDCMMLALKSHLCSGRRIYAECGGLAYLCHEIEMPDGQRWPMAGLLPAVARFDPTPVRPTPTRVELAHDTWLGCAGQCWRGYLNPRWSLQGSTALEPCALASAGHEFDIVKRNRAVGSRVYTHFAAQGGLLDRFFNPLTSCSTVDRPVV